MTKAVEIPIQRFRGDGVTVSFAPGFEVFDLSDVVVELYDALENSIGVAKDGSGAYDYTVSGTLDAAIDRYPTPSVVFNNAPPANYYIGLGRAGDLEQTMDLTEGASLPSESVERRFDRLVSMIQDVSEAVGRATKGFLGLPDRVDVGGRILRNVGNPVSAQDAATRSWVLSNFPTAVTGASAMKNMVDTYGAVGDDSTNNHTAFTNAGQAGTIVFIPPGTFQLNTGTIELAEGTIFIGSGAGNTIIKANHTAGPVFHSRYPFTQILNMTIDAGTTRQAAAANTTNFGILKEAVDAAGQHAKFHRYENLEIVNQPSSGIVVAGSFSAVGIRGCKIHSNGGHGVVVDDGAITGRSNLSRPGGVVVEDCEIYDNGGHWARIGSNTGAVGVTQYPYRVRLHNVDAYRNADDAAVRLEDAALFVYGENVVVELCGMGGSTVGNAPARAAAYIAGRSVQMNNNRYISTVTPPLKIGNVTGGNDTRAVAVNDGRVSGNYNVPGGSAADADPFCHVHASARAVRVTMLNEQGITRVINTDAPIDTEWQKADLRRWDIETLFTRMASIEAREIADDDFSTLEFAGANSSFALVNCEALGGKWALIWFRVGLSPYVQLIAAPTAGGVSVTTGALNGTTGTDTELTISAHTDNKLYIENRTGAALDYSVLLLANLGQDLLRSEV